MSKAALTKPSIEKYSYRLSWSDEDREFVGLCAEFPGLSWLDRDPGKAIKGIMKAVESVIEMIQKDGKEPPQPLSSRDYSGKFVVRIPKEMHKNLTIAAAEEGVSLNQWVTAKLAK